MEKKNSTMEKKNSTMEEILRRPIYETMIDSSRVTKVNINNKDMKLIDYLVSTLASTEIELLNKYIYLKKENDNTAYM